MSEDRTDDGKTIVKIKDSMGRTQEIALWSEEHARIFREIIETREESDQIEKQLLALQIIDDPIQAVHVKIAMLLDELWPDSTPEGQLRQLQFDHKFTTARRDQLKAGLQHSGAILLRAPGAIPDGFRKPGG